MKPRNKLRTAVHPVIDERLADFHACKPGVVEAFDSSTGKARVRPLGRDPDGRRYPAIGEVPVKLMGRGAGFFASIPVAVGDKVLLVFADTSLDELLTRGDNLTPADPRRHAFTDAIAIAGWHDFRDPGPTVNGLALGREDGSLVIRVTNSGKITIGNELAGTDLLQILDDALAELMTAQTNTAIGPQPFEPTTIAALGQLRSLLQTLAP